MKCPHCNETIKLESRVYRNIESYHQSAYATTECCNKLVLVTGIMCFNATKCDEKGKTEDDWGNPFTKSE